MKKHFIVIISLVLFFAGVVIGQMYFELKTDFINAAYSTSKPANGHSWAEMECTEGLCIDSANNRVGIGISNPAYKLDIVGNIHATGDLSSDGTITAITDMCIGSGACLSQLDEFIGSQVLVNGAHTYGDCNAAGGTVVDSDVSLKQCKFNTSSCPTSANSNGTGSWTQYKSYCAQVEAFCQGVNGDNGGCSGTSCSHVAKAWGNSYSSCSYTTGGHMAGGICGMTWGTCAGGINQIGCY